MIDRYTQNFLKYAYVKCSRCEKECEYSSTLPRPVEFLHMEEDEKLHGEIDVELNEPYCLDCILEIQGGKKDD